MDIDSRGGESQSGSNDPESRDISQSRSPAISSPDTPIAPTQWQYTAQSTTADVSSPRIKDAKPTERTRPIGRSVLAGNRGASVEAPTRRAKSAQREAHPGRRERGPEQELGHLFGQVIPARSSALDAFTNGGLYIDEQADSALEPSELMTLPSPPPSDANGSPLLSPIEAVAELPGLDRVSRHSVSTSARRERASSSALDFGTGAEPQVAPDIFSPKDRTMSESRRQSATPRAQSVPMFKRKGSATKSTGSSTMPLKEPLSLRSAKELPAPLKMDRNVGASRSSRHDPQPPSPPPDAMPIPPFSMPTFLQLELSSSRPSPLYIYRPSTTDHPFEATAAKAERLLNFLVLPPQLERVLWFGTFACVDAWLYNFTILPLRFSSALIKLIRSLAKNVWSELKFLAEFIPLGVGRVWQRQVQGYSEPPTPPVDGNTSHQNSGRSPAIHSPFPEPGARSPPMLARSGKNKRHRRTRSVASSLVSAEKADILKGFLIVVSTVILMRFDASMMYHSIRGQAAIKLYVIYNALEVFDRLLSAIGQDILECLFSPESLARHANGRSKILRPLSLFPIALIYVLIHATALYYQVITLNVAVNSYSNALLTLLMSNQFVEIKSTVFKRIEKENLFQMTCADVVERFQLWLMLVIIASRNIIETSAASATTSTATTPPPTTPTLLPFSFTVFPSLSFSQILNPFILVLGTETIVDWIKHAYITKFNNVKPNLYGRYLDVLAKDYYGNAFSDPALMKRIGLPVIPLTCLAIRAAVQTYHMFREHLVPAPLASSVTTDFSSSPTISPTTAAALKHIDSLFLKVVGDYNLTNGTSEPSQWLGQLPSDVVARFSPSWLTGAMYSIPLPSTDDLLSWGSTILVLALLYLVLLALKIVLGMALLSYARTRYAGMKSREQESTFQDGRRNGGWGVTELDEDKRRWIYADDPDKAKKLRERDRETREREMGGGSGSKRDGGKSVNYDGVERYKLGGSKRIW